MFHPPHSTPAPLLDSRSIPALHVLGCRYIITATEMKIEHATNKKDHTVMPVENVITHSCHKHSAF